MSRLFDQNGRYLGDASDGTVEPIDSGAAQPSETFGAALFEFFHPFTVQAEYEAVGKTAPAVSDIMTQAVSDMETQAVSGVTQTADQLATAIKLAALAGIVLGSIYVYRKFTAGS